MTEKKQEVISKRRRSKEDDAFESGVVGACVIGVQVIHALSVLYDKYQNERRFAGEKEYLSWFK